MPKSPSVKWTRDHFLIALNLYGKIPFGKLSRTNAVIIEVASKMGRSPSSLAMKLVNFASLDPVQRARGIIGLPGATKQDRKMWNEFRTHLGLLAPESEQLLHDLFTNDENSEVDFLRSDEVRIERPILLKPDGPTEAAATIRARRGQQFFRQTVLSAYGVACCVSGVNVPELLVASHIKPWSRFPEERLNPTNGLCLSRLHDAAFDSGLITFDKNLCLILSKRLTKYFPQPTLEHNFLPFDGAPIRLPKKITYPNITFIAYHRESIFVD